MSSVPISSTSSKLNVTLVFCIFIIDVEDTFIKQNLISVICFSALLGKSKFSHDATPIMANRDISNCNF